MLLSSDTSYLSEKIYLTSFDCISVTIGGIIVYSASFSTKLSILISLLLSKTSSLGTERVISMDKRSMRCCLMNLTRSSYWVTSV